MAVSPYRVTPARIGNSSGLRLPAAFYRDRCCYAWRQKNSSRARQKKTP
jgi:hypothetical protein